MSNFKVGDVCMYKPRVNEKPSKNFGKIFTLVSYMGVKPGYNFNDRNWKTDTKFLYNGISLEESYEDFICESQMLKLDNPDDNSVDEMIEIVGKAPTVKEYELEI